VVRLGHIATNYLGQVLSSSGCQSFHKRKHEEWLHKLGAMLLHNGTIEEQLLALLRQILARGLLVRFKHYRLTFTYERQHRMAAGISGLALTVCSSVGA
jgi:hypothetical protein